MKPVEEKEEAVEWTESEKAVIDAISHPFASRIPASREDSLQWANLRLQVVAKKAEAEKLAAQAQLNAEQSKILEDYSAQFAREVAARVGADLAIYDCKIDPQGNLYFELKTN